MSNSFITEYLGTPARYSKVLDFTDRVLKKTVPWIRIGSTWRGMASIESRMNSYHLLSQVLAFDIPGDIVEIGCNQGETSVVLQRVIEDFQPLRQLHVYDSFAGVPTGEPEDQDVYRPGDMTASESQLKSNFDQLQLTQPTIHRGWFEQTIPSQLPEQIAFAMVDGDLYRSTHYALEGIYPRLSQGAICLFGVYWDPSTSMPITRKATYRSPGVKKACDEFLADKSERVSVLYAGQYAMGFFRKL